MKILVVHNHYRLKGGEDSVFESECAMLEKAGHTVVRYEKSNEDITADRGGRLSSLFPLRFVNKVLLALQTVWNWGTYHEMRTLLRQERPDVVHCHNTFPLISPSVYWAAAKERVPVVQTLHNYRLACLNGYLFRNAEICEDCLGRFPWRGVCRRCYRSSAMQSAAVAAMLLIHRALGTYRTKVSRYVALTAFARNKFISAGLPAVKIEVKANATDFGRKDWTTIRGISSERPRQDFSVVFLYLGRLSAEKGPDVLVDAWHIFQNSDSAVSRSARLVFAGDGPERQTLEKAAAGLRQIDFIGSVPKNEVPKLLELSSALILPSRCYEQFSTTAMEAMAAGRPVVVSKSAKAGTLVQDGVSGFFFDTGIATDLANVLSTLAQNPERIAAMGREAAAAFTSSSCVPERNVVRLEEIYRSCCTAASDS